MVSGGPSAINTMLLWARLNVNLVCPCTARYVPGLLTIHFSTVHPAIQDHARDPFILLLHFLLVSLHEMYDPDSSRRVAVLKLEINAAGAAIKGPQPTRDIHLPSVPSDVTLHTPL